MLRSDNLDSPESHQIPSDTTKKPTSEDIENFYQVIARYSYDKQETSVGLLAILRKNYFEYLLHYLKNRVTDEKVFETKKRMLIQQINCLQDKKFFSGKLEPPILDFIKKDISNNGKELLTVITEEDRDDFLYTIQNINDKCQATIVPSEKNFPDKIKSGLSFNERDSLTYSEYYQTSSLSNSLNAKGLEHFKKQEWHAAIKLFKEAILTEEQLSSETKMEKNADNIAIYTRNLSYASNSYGIDLVNIGEYKKAIEYFKIAIELIDKMQFKYSKRKDKELLTDFHRNLGLSLNSVAVELYENLLYKEAIQYYQEALEVYKKIHPEFLNQTDQSIMVIFQRNLAYTLFELGRIECVENKEELAISLLEKAKELTKQFFSTKKENDEKFISDCYRHLALAYNIKGNKNLTNNNLLEAKENYLTAISALNQISTNFFTPEDRKASEVYMKNLSNTLEVFVPQSILAKNPASFFKAEQQDWIIDMKESPQINAYSRKRKRKS